MKMKKCVLFFLLVFSALACTTDSYEKGDGEYSMLQGEFVEAHVNASLNIDYATTDSDERLTFKQSYTKAWANTPDSSYRAVLYFKKVNQQPEIISLNRVNVMTVIAIDSLEKKLKKSMKTDPLTLESMWMSKNKRYLNAGFYLKSGLTDDESAMQQIGLVSDSLQLHADGKKILWLRFYHDQGGVPEYYSERGFLSLPVQNLGADSIRLAINTYSGVVVKKFSIK